MRSWREADSRNVVLFVCCVFFRANTQLLKGTEDQKEDLRVTTEASIKAIQEAAGAKQEEVIKMLLDVVARVQIVRRNDPEKAK